MTAFIGGKPSDPKASMVPPAVASGASCRYRSPSSCTMVSIRFGFLGRIDRLSNTVNRLTRRQ